MLSSVSSKLLALVTLKTSVYYSSMNQNMACLLALMRSATAPPIFIFPLLPPIPFIRHYYAHH